MDMQLMLKLMNTLGQLRRHERWIRPQLEAHQTESLNRLREYAYARSPFYQQFHKGLSDRPLQELPVLTKTMVMENFDELVTDRAVRLENLRAHMASDREGRRFLNRFWVTATSGSTGHPGIFLFDRDEWTNVIASFGRAHEWAGEPMIPTHRMRMASVASLTSGSPWHVSAQIAATGKSWWVRAWMPTLSFDASQPVAEIVQQLNTWQPHLLTGYPSMMRILADEQLGGRLDIQPHTIISGSEVLTEETRWRIKAAWGHLPFDGYGATEAGGWLAAETSDHTGLYLYEDNVIFEVVDEQYRPVPKGMYGDKVLITVLSSRTQPLIRYELSDSVRLASGPNPNDLPFARIDEIQGRTEEILRLPAVSDGEVAVHPITFHHVLDSLPVSGWQVVQDEVGLRVLLSGAKSSELDSMLVDALKSSLAAQNVAVPRISVQHVDIIPKNATGKAPLIKAYRAAL
ncbi:MAG TPA: AMP-binding protein [Anaerolineales bacterium]|nr:AMP-binding protein [Anaerolineales bacterium]